jgi:hypothetical protein
MLFINGKLSNEQKSYISHFKKIKIKKKLH